MIGEVTEMRKLPRLVAEAEVNKKSKIVYGEMKKS